MERLEALKLIETNRKSINQHIAEEKAKTNADFKEKLNSMKTSFVDLIETARLCEAGEHHSLKNIKKFKSCRSPGLKFGTNTLLYLTDMDDKLAIMRIEKDGSYSFFFSGTKLTDPQPDIAQETDIMKGFLKRYDRFEKRFYSFVDKHLAKDASHIEYLKNKLKN